jgi:hypothetical protein
MIYRLGGISGTVSTMSLQITAPRVEVGGRTGAEGSDRTGRRPTSDGRSTRAITGHVTEEMTEHYSHVDRAEKLRAADQGRGAHRSPRARQRQHRLNRARKWGTGGGVSP